MFILALRFHREEGNKLKTRAIDDCPGVEKTIIGYLRTIHAYIYPYIQKQIR